MATATPTVGRLDRIIKELERLHADAQGIFDAPLTTCVVENRQFRSGF
jgi:hypothetical protein